MGAGVRVSALVLKSFILAATLAGCAPDSGTRGPVAGDAERGRLLLRQYGCASCHTIPGVATADANVGPPLTRVASRVYLAGMLPNTPDNMARWIQAPQKIDPQTVMPDMQVPEPHVRDIVAYLYRLR